MLLAKGADVNLRNDDGENPLRVASCYGRCTASARKEKQDTYNSIEKNETSRLTKSCSVRELMQMRAISLEIHP